MGLYREHFIPADPPLEGRYVVWRRSDDGAWSVARINADGEWRHEDSSGPIHDVLWFIDIGPASEPQQRNDV